MPYLEEIDLENGTVKQEQFRSGNLFLGGPCYNESFMFYYMSETLKLLSHIIFRQGKFLTEGKLESLVFV